MNWIGCEKKNAVKAEVTTASKYLMQEHEKMTNASVRILSLWDETLTQDVSYTNEF